MRNLCKLSEIRTQARRTDPSCGWRPTRRSPASRRTQAGIADVDSLRGPGPTQRAGDRDRLVLRRRVVMRHQREPALVDGGVERQVRLVRARSLSAASGRAGSSSRSHARSCACRARRAGRGTTGTSSSARFGGVVDFDAFASGIGRSSGSGPRMVLGPHGEAPPHTSTQSRRCIVRDPQRMPVITGRLP